MHDGAAPLQIEDEDDDEDEHDFLWPRLANKKSTAPTPLQRLVLLSAASSETAGRASLTRARRRLRRWVYFGFVGEMFLVK
jgi:hypothetical protein